MLANLAQMTLATEAISAIPETAPQERTDWPLANTTVQTREMLLVVAASVLATVPVWLATYPPMVDLPQHAAQIALLRNLHDPNFRFADLFRVNWFTPYLLGYMLAYAIAPVVGIVTAFKVIITLALIGIPLSTAVLMRETGADPYWALLTIPSMYGFTFAWGFFNFLVATPLGLLFLAYVIRHARRPTWRSSLGVGTFAVLLFFCHALICLFFLAIAAVYVVAESRSLRRAALVFSPIVAVLPVILAWYFRTSRGNAGITQGLVWDLGWMSSPDPQELGGRITGFFPRLLGLSPRVCNLVLGVVLFVLPFLAGARVRRRLAVWVPLAVCAAVLLFGPTTALGTWAIYPRFTVFALPFFVLGLETLPVARPAWRAAPIFLLVGWMSITISATLRYEAEARGFKQVLSAMEPNERALSLMFLQNSKGSPAPVFLHFPAWYSATKQGVVDINFAVFPVELVRFRPTMSAPDASVSEWHPQAFRWKQWRGGTYRYFVVHAPVDLGYRLFAWAPCPVSLVTRSEDWWLYEKDPRCASEQGAAGSASRP